MPALSERPVFSASYLEDWKRWSVDLQINNYGMHMVDLLSTNPLHSDHLRLPREGEQQHK